jgi:hypothetical protein
MITIITNKSITAINDNQKSEMMEINNDVVISSESESYKVLQNKKTL